MDNKERLEIAKVFHSRYLIESIIGKGGMGTVYLARDIRLKGKMWAIKETFIKKENYQRFADEAKILVALDHPYLPKIVDYYPPNEYGYSYVVMDFIEGQTLLKLFEANNKKMDVRIILRYVLQLCELFDYLHNKHDTPIIYRDLKPANIMIDEQDNIRLIDFGIARSYKEGKPLDTVQMGTLAFSAPEQFKDTQTDHRADIYSLGALTYYLLSEGQFYNHTMKPLSDFRKDLPNELVSIIMKMLREDPIDRYQNIMDVKEELTERVQSLDGKIQETVTIAKAQQIYHENMVLKEASSEDHHKLLNQALVKIVGVINLSNRAGSTFVSVNLAKYLAGLNATTRIIEMPFAPYIFDYIGLEQRLNKTGFEKSLYFYSYPHVIYQDKPIERNKETIEDDIIWTIPDPRKEKIDQAKWTYHHMIRLLNSSRKANITILDIGSYHHHPSIKPILDEIDLLLIIVDPMPSEVMTSLSFVDEWVNNKGYEPMEVIINHWTSGINQKELEKTFSSKPLTFIPSIPTFYIHKAVYNCTIPYSVKEINEHLKIPFYRISKKIIDEDLLSFGHKKKQRSGSTLIQRWLKRG